MLIANSSRYPTDDVVKMVRYAFSATPCGHVGVEVYDLIGTLDSAKGRAYPRVPSNSTFYGVSGISAVVKLEIGPPNAYPSDNLYVRTVGKRSIPMTADLIYDDDGELRSGPQLVEAVRPLLREHEIVVGAKNKMIRVEKRVRMPYGGRGSPEFYYLDWQEGLIAFAAHEARHIWQFNRRMQEWRQGVPRGKMTPTSEDDAERVALRVLTAFRRERAIILSAPIRTAAKGRGARDNTLHGVARLLGRFPEERDDDR
jgi:hypothetical protein